MTTWNKYDNVTGVLPEDCEFTKFTWDSSRKRVLTEMQVPASSQFIVGGSHSDTATVIASDSSRSCEDYYDGKAPQRPRHLTCTRLILTKTEGDFV
jgi:hypothetical protein